MRQDVLSSRRKQHREDSAYTLLTDLFPLSGTPGACSPGYLYCMMRMFQTVPGTGCILKHLRFFARCLGQNFSADDLKANISCFRQKAKNFFTPDICYRTKPERAGKPANDLPLQCIKTLPCRSGWPCCASLQLPAPHKESIRKKVLQCAAVTSCLPVPCWPF